MTAAGTLRIQLERPPGRIDALGDLAGLQAVATRNGAAITSKRLLAVGFFANEAGISHNLEASSDRSDMEAGANLLRQAMLTKAGA